MLSHTSTQKSPKYLNLHKLPAEFYLGFFFCCLPKRVGFGGRVERARQSMVLVRAVALRNSASSQPKGPFPRHVLFGACGSDLSVVTGLLLVSVCTPLFLKPQIRQARAQWSSLLLRAAQAGTVCPLPLMCNCPFFVWPVAVRVDGPKPSGLHNFCSCLRPDLSWALWKI